MKEAILSLTSHESIACLFLVSMIDSAMSTVVLLITYWNNLFKVLTPAQLKAHIQCSYVWGLFLLVSEEILFPHYGLVKMTPG